MRLIATDTLDIVEFAYDQIPEYAILSHRYGAEEVSLQEMQQANSTIKEKRGFKKVQQCCARAKADGFDYVWVDTCCINQTSSNELSEAINSMYAWYYQAARCYAYLADVPSQRTFRESEWFTRGWTLQELVAPEEVYFLDQQWKDLGTKGTLQQALHECTGIPPDVLSGEAGIGTASVAQRMSWAAKRQTTRPEDKAYCLLGIFGIQMPLIYGEGERAFERLQHEIMKTSDDHSLFAWASADSRGGLLATSPAAFAASGRVREQAVPSPLNPSRRGMELEAPIIGRGPAGLCLAVLNCVQPVYQKQQNTWRDEPIGIWVRDKQLTMKTFERVGTEMMMSVDLSKFSEAQRPVRHICIEVMRINPLRRPPRSGKGNAANRNAASNVAAQGSLMEKLDIYDDDELSDLMNVADPAALVQAAQNGDKDRVWLLLSRTDVSVNQIDASGTSALSAAAQNDHAEVVRLLLARDAHANAMDDSGQAALHLAAEKGLAGIVELLASTKYVALDLPDRSGSTPLLLAVRQQQQEIVKILLAHGSYRYATDSSGWPILAFAAASGDEAIVRMLLEDTDTNSGGDGMTEFASFMDKHSRTILEAAAEKGHTSTMALLLQQGALVDGRGELGRTTLHWASREGLADIAKLLLEAGAVVDALDGYNHTALHHAAYAGHDDVVSVLLEGGADAHARTAERWTPLWCAADGCHGAAFKLLIEAGADIQATTNGKTTVLHQAYSKCDAEAAKFLVEHGASIDAEPNSVLDLVQWAAKEQELSSFELLMRTRLSTFAPGTRRTAAGWAAENGSAALMRKLLDDGIDANTVEENQTLLEIAARRGHEPVVCVLLDTGANVNRSGEDDNEHGYAAGSTPLSKAADSGHESTVKLLLERGADPDGMWVARGKHDDRAGQTPLRAAMRSREYGVMKLLLDHGASPNVVGTERHETLWYAVEQSDAAAARLLIEAGAHLESQDCSGLTALYLAAGSANPEIVRLLVDAGASVATETEYGRTPLWAASRKGDAETVRLLLDAGADIERVDIYKDTPLAVAYEMDRLEVARILLERGAKTDFLNNDSGSASEAGQGKRRGRKSKELQALFQGCK